MPTSKLNKISIFNACRNRRSFLEISLPTWLNFPEVSEIVIVDWSSSKSIADLKNLNSNIIKVIEVQGETTWNLSKAFNLAAEHTTHSNILKLDTDYILKPGFFDSHKLDGNEFIAGDFTRAPDLNSWNLNGMVFLKREHFFNVGGYNESIQSYGYDDCDLYKRLQRSGLTRKTINFNTIEHIPHDDKLRMDNSSQYSKLREISWNHVVSNLIRWNSTQKRTSYLNISANSDRLLLKVIPESIVFIQIRLKLINFLHFFWPILYPLKKFIWEDSRKIYRFILHLLSPLKK
jgi:hypothetical protein